MKFKILLIAGFLFLMVIPQATQAQGRKSRGNASTFRGFKKKFGKHRRYNSVGFTLNAMNYFGDLVPKSSFISTDIGFTRPAFGFVLNHRFGPRYELRGTFTTGTLRGDDFKSADPNDESGQFRYARNLHFRNVINELSVTAVFDLFENQGTHISRVKFTPYFFVGMAGVLHNPQAQLPGGGDWVDLQPLGTEGQNSDLYPERKPYKRLIVALPIGLGVRYKVNQNIDISFEIGYRHTFTDYLDDVSGNYASSTALVGDELVFADRSLEAMAAVSGDARDLNTAVTSRRVDINGVEHIAGYGYDPLIDFGNDDPRAQNIRGNPNDNDIYVVTSVQLTYIIGKNYRRAKFR